MLHRIMRFGLHFVASCLTTLLVNDILEPRFSSVTDGRNVSGRKRSWPNRNTVLTGIGTRHLPADSKGDSKVSRQMNTVS